MKFDYDPFSFLSSNYLYTSLFYAYINGDCYKFEHDYMRVLMHEEDDEMECGSIFDWFEIEITGFFEKNPEVE